MNTIKSGSKVFGSVVKQALAKSDLVFVLVDGYIENYTAQELIDGIKDSEQFTVERLYAQGTRFYMESPRVVIETTFVIEA